MTRITTLSAVDARAALQSREISAVELTTACLERIEAVDGKTNAMVTLAADRALSEASAIDRAGADALRPPLAGLPIGIKDLNVTEGIRTTWGSPIYADNVPDKDERVVRVLREAGGIVIGKTNTPEFGAGANTTNAIFGPTRNPFDLDRTCGGSSGGSAVALAADFVPLAGGSDTGGSLRTPAAFCGVVSIRPTPGVVPSDRRVIGHSTYGVQGPMARTVADAALMLSVMAGPDVCDPLSAPLDAQALAKIDDCDLGSLRVAFSEDLGFAAIDNDIRKIFRDRMQALKPAFGALDEANPSMEHANRVFWVLRGAHYVAAHQARYDNHRELLGPNVLSNVEAGLAMTGKDFGWAGAECTRIYRSLQDYFRDFDLLITPTAAVPPFPVEQLYCDEINGQKLDNYIQWVDIVAGITLTGHPVVQLPCGLDHTGTPFGLQLVGPALHSEKKLIAIAAAMESWMSTTPELARPTPNLD